MRAEHRWASTNESGEHWQPTLQSVDVIRVEVAEDGAEREADHHAALLLQRPASVSLGENNLLTPTLSMLPVQSTEYQYTN